MNLLELQKNIPQCRACPRLIRHCQKIAKEKRKAFMDWEYWGRPVPGFGDPNAQLILIGLAPAAHGANRTGRMFTGDRSGEWLYRALHEAGFANQALSESKEDGLILKNAYITSVVHCAPPDNKPTPSEQKKCSTDWLRNELDALKKKKAYLALGNIAYQNAWSHLTSLPKKPKFAHGKCIDLEDGKALFLSYHPSQQNTFTGRLTKPMFDSVFQDIRLFLNG